MRESAWNNIFGDELANRVHDVCGFDDEGETRLCVGQVDIRDFGPLEELLPFVGSTPDYWLWKSGLLRLDSRKIDPSPTNDHFKVLTGALLAQLICNCPR